MSRKEGLPRSGSRGRKALGISGGPIRKHNKGAKIDFKSRQPDAFQNPFLKALIVGLTALPYVVISLVVIASGEHILGTIMLLIPIALLVTFRAIYKMSQ